MSVAAEVRTESEIKEKQSGSISDHVECSKASKEGRDTDLQVVMGCDKSQDLIIKDVSSNCRPRTDAKGELGKMTQFRMQVFSQ